MKVDAQVKGRALVYGMPKISPVEKRLTDHWRGDRDVPDACDAFSLFITSKPLLVDSDSRIFVRVFHLQQSD